MSTECVKCDKPMPEKNDGWVECSCSAHTGWYCDSCSPGNDCYDDEECDCCNPACLCYCECDFPKFIIDDGIQSCSRCGKDDHYKCGVVADHSDYEEEEDEEEFYEVSCAENPDVEYFNTLEEAKAFCDKHGDLDYGLIMLCDKHKKHIGDWGDYEEVDHNYCEKCGRPSEVWGGNPHKGMCKKCSISEGWAKWCDKHDKISYKTEKGEGCRDCKAERK